jgi:hypothetical protein
MMRLNSISDNWHLFTVSGYFRGPESIAVIEYEFMKEHGMAVGSEISISNLKDHIRRFIAVPCFKYAEDKPNELKDFKITHYIESLELMTNQSGRLADKTNEIEELILSESVIKNYNLGSSVLLRLDKQAIEKPF